MTVLRQKCSCLPHKFVIFQQWETQQMDKLACKHDWQKIHSVNQRSFIWSFKIPRIETQQINQFPQPKFLLPSVQIIQVLCIHLKKLDLVVVNHEISENCALACLSTSLITQELNKIAALPQRGRLKITFS